MKIEKQPKGIDGSNQFKIVSEKGGYVEFSIMNNELSAHTWRCEGEGRLFLKEIERYANKNKLKLLIPTVLSARLRHILLRNNYSITKIYDNFIGDNVELFVKK